jgi:hypothetical protein
MYLVSVFSLIVLGEGCPESLCILVAVEAAVLLLIIRLSE